ncbi:MAG: hypothetical protein HQ530_04275 [Parcubacteria group bacterium]|nr:hypothetical protein [Parcubacteria group bacterium]
MTISKLFTALFIVAGLLLTASLASASPADTLQPASTITYNEEVIVNDTIKVNSAYVGSTEADVGGVTFFNGTIVNNSVDEDGASIIPVTFGDDVRIDGEIYRTEKGGDDPIKVTDTIMPTANNTYSLGTSGSRFKDGYLSGSLAAASVTASGAVTAGSVTASGTVTAGSIVTAGTVDGVDVSAIPSTYVSQSSPSWDSRSGKTSIPASSCHPEEVGLTYAFKSNGSAIYPVIDPGTLPPGMVFYCPVQLPDGATVTSAEAYVSDNGASIIVASFYSASLASFSPNAPRTDSTNGLGSGNLTIDLDGIDEVVDNSDTVYYMSINFFTVGTDYDFHGGVVNYTYTQPY